jgi:hypothetical protein
MKKIFIVLIIILAIPVTIFALPFILGVITRNIPPIDDADLRLQQVVIAPEENAYYYVVRMGKAFNEEFFFKHHKQITAHSNGEIWDEEFVRKLLDANRQSLTYFNKAANRPKFQIPAFKNPEEITMGTKAPLIRNWAKITRINKLKSLYLAKQGQYQAALNQALQSVKLGQKIQEAQISHLIEYSMGILIERIGLNAIQAIIAKTELPPEELKLYIQKLDQFFAGEQGLKNAIKTDYHMLIRLISDINKKAPIDYIDVEGLIEIPFEFKNIIDLRWFGFYFRPNETKLIFAQNTREAIRNIGKLCQNIELKPTKLFRIEDKSLVEKYFTENLVGKALLDVFTVNFYEMFIEIECKQDFFVGSTQILIAVRAYKLDKGALPTSLNKLVPQYLDAIPTDPFNGQPLRYSYKEKIIYSIGEIEGRRLITEIKF